MEREIGVEERERHGSHMIEYNFPLGERILENEWDFREFDERVFLGFFWISSRGFRERERE